MLNKSDNLTAVGRGGRDRISNHEFSMTAHTSQSTSQPDPQTDLKDLLDLDLALARLGGDTVLLSDLIDLFLDESSYSLREFQTAIEVRGLSRLKSATTALRSSAAHFVGNRVTGLALQIEALCRQGNLDGALLLTDSFEIEFNMLVNALQAERQKRAR